ncbi:MAG: DNA-binding protein, partial [Bacteroidaceae bacterium]|nr:DNA-binding protein [Bacteroidaceae bacterium]
MSCSDDEATYLNEVRVTKSIVAIPAKGGMDSITINAVDSWTIKGLYDSKGQINKWLTVSDSTGVAGETKVYFSADSTGKSNTASLWIECAGKKQLLTVIQTVDTKVEEATCAEVNAGPESKTYRVTGTCTKIANTTYGNWYLEDETGSVYIYGTLDKNGGTKNFTSLGIEVGDIVTVEGPKTVYNGTVELVDVTVINITKSLVKVDSLSVDTVGIEGGELVAYLTCKGINGVNIEIPADAESWISIKSISTSGTNSVVKFNVAANEAGDRNTTLTFTTNDGTQNYSTEAAIIQKGSIVDASVAEFNAANVGNTQYRITGVISKVANAAKGRFYVKDYSGETYVYNLSGFEATGLKVGDIVTLVGKRDEYNGTIEMTSATVESSISVTASTVTDVLAAEDSKEKYYMVKGTVSEII